MKANQAIYRVRTMCRVLEVSRSGYYAWLKREPSARAQANAELLEAIQEIHTESDGTYGAPRIHAELQDRGPEASLNRVARVMKGAEIQGVSPRKWTRTTLRGKSTRLVPDLVDRDFTATGPDQLWVADITYVSTWAGFLFLAIVLDVWSRRIVGWAMATHLRTELVQDALDMAVARRGGRGVIHHSDQGCQYTSLAFGRRCELMGVQISMGSVGDAYDNAMAESFFGTLECELLDRYTFRTPAKHARRCSATSRGGTIPDGVTLRLAICRRPSSRQRTGPGPRGSPAQLTSRPLPQASWLGPVLLRCKQRKLLTPSEEWEKKPGRINRSTYLSTESG